MLRLSHNDEDTDSDIGRRDTSGSPSMDTPVTENSTQDEEYLALLSRKWTRKTKLWRATVCICICLLASWLLGYFGFSAVWVLVMAVGAYQVWDGHVVGLVEEDVRYEALRHRNRRAQNSEETAEWLNIILNRWWVFASESIFTQIKSSLDPILNECKPSYLQSVELLQLSLGNQTPFVSQVRVFNVPEPKNGHRQLVVEAQVKLHCDDFNMVLKSRVGHKEMSMDMDLVMEKLHIGGKMQISVQMNREAPFPHFTKISVTFVDKPEVWFSIRILKALSMMEVPVLKTWVHNLVMDALTTALVDPGKVVINLNPREPSIPGQSDHRALAQGVLTMFITWADQGPSSSCKTDGKIWCVLRLGEEETVVAPNTCPKDSYDSCSFIVDSPQDDILVVKVKTKRIISTMTLATYEVPLAEVSQKKIVEMVLGGKGTKGNGVPPIRIKLQYTWLPPVILEQPILIRSQPDGAVDSEPGSRAGVLYVHVHGAEGLAMADGRERPNPFCLVLSNGKKVKTTHFARHTCNPKWDSSVEFIVADYSTTVISFAVWSWDSAKMADSSFLGLASLTMNSDEVSIVEREIPLSVTPSGTPHGLDSGVISVSALFREAPLVAQSSAQTNSKEAQMPQMGHAVESSLVNTAMLLSTMQNQEIWCRDRPVQTTDGMMEMSLVRAKDLVSKDFNGYSDPYCEVKLNEECKFKTGVRRKTLNPQWDENFILQVPAANDILTVTVWDHDTFGMRDFLGSVSLGAEDVRMIAEKESGQWVQLKNTASGQLEIRLRIVSSDTENPIAISEHLPPTLEPEAQPPPAEPSEVLPISQDPKPPTFQTFKPTPSPKLPSKDPEEPKVPESSTPGAARRPSAIGMRAPISHPPPPPPIVPTEPMTKKSPSPSKASSSGASTPGTDTPKAATSNAPTSGTHAYSSLRKMKKKVKKAFGQPLRRFRSEASVHEEKAKGLRDRIRIERRKDDAYSSCTDIDSIPQDVLDGAAVRAETGEESPLLKRNNLNFSVAPELDLKLRYYNVSGRVVQATGLEVKHVNTLYCRIKLLGENQSPAKNKKESGGGRTIAKSKILPANRNVPFNLDFKMDNSSGISNQSKIRFDILTATKEQFASKQVTLQELLEDVCVAKAGEQMRACLSLDCGATLELVVCFGKCEAESSGQQPSSVSKLLRSWSVHKIGKI